MSDDRPKDLPEEPAPGEKAGSYTARPSQGEPEEGTTRDHDEEAVERTGSGPDGDSDRRPG